MDTAIKRHGGKSYLAKAIIAAMPPRCKNPNKPADDDPGWLHYVEPYFGGGSVLFANDPEGISEVVNDVDGDLTTFWICLKNEAGFAMMQRSLQGTPVSELEFSMAKHPSKEQEAPWERACEFFIRNRQSRQGLEKGFATLTRNRTRRGMNEQASAWLSAIDGLPEFHARLKRVVILHSNAVKVIKQQDGTRTLFYCDPPYMHETRHNGGGEYKHEMTREQHVELLETLATVNGRFILSGYDSDLYHDFAQQHGWSCDSIEIDNKASGSKTKEKKIENIWKNYA